MPTRIHTQNRRPARVYLREWLDHRNKTAEQLASLLDTSKSVISKLETGKQRYNQDWLERIAYALNCEVRDLYRDPNQLTAEDLLRGATPDQYQEVVNFTKYVLGKTGTEG